MRKHHNSPVFKAKIALEALREAKPLTQIGAEQDGIDGLELLRPYCLHNLTPPTRRSDQSTSLALPAVYIDKFAGAYRPKGQYEVVSKRVTIRVHDSKTACAPPP